MELAVLAGALVLGPLLFALAAAWRRWTKAWQVLLAAYAGGVCGGEAFRAWYAARSDALMRAPGPHLHSLWIAMPSGALTLGERLRVPRDRRGGVHRSVLADHVGRRAGVIPRIMER